MVEPGPVPQPAPKPDDQRAELERLRKMKRLQELEAKAKAPAAAQVPNPANGAGLGPVNPMVEMGLNAQREALLSQKQNYDQNMRTLAAANNAGVNIPGNPAELAAKAAAEPFAPRDPSIRLRPDPFGQTPFNKDEAIGALDAQERARQAKQDRREAAAAYGAGSDFIQTTDEGGNVVPGSPSDTYVGKTIIGAPIQLGQGLAEGVANIWNNAVGMADDFVNTGNQMLLGDRAVKFDTPKIEVPANALVDQGGPLATELGVVPRIAGQFMAGRVPLGKAAPGGGVGAEIAKDALSFAATTDKETPRISDMIPSGTPGIGFMADMLRTQPGENTATAFAKNVIEDATISTAAIGFLKLAGKGLDVATGGGKATGSTPPPGTLTPVSGLSDAERKAIDLIIRKLAADGVTIEDVKRVAASLGRRGDSGVYETLAEIVSLSGKSSGANTRGLAMAGGAVPGPTQQALVARVNENTAKLPDRLSRAATRATGQDASNAVATLDDLNARLKTEAGPLYEDFYNAPVDQRVYDAEIAPVLSAPHGQAAMERAARGLGVEAASLQARVASGGASPKAQAALQRTYDAAEALRANIEYPQKLAQARKAAQQGDAAAMSELAALEANRPPTIPPMALDHVKRAFDDLIDEAGQATYTGGNLRAAKRNFAESVSNATGGAYGNAVRTYEGIKRLEDAFETGLKALTQKTWQLERDLAKGRGGAPYSGGEIEALAMGVARHIEDLIEANDQAALTKLLKGKALQNMAMALGNEKAAKMFEQSIRRLAGNREFGRRVAGGSDTAMRQAAIRDAGVEAEDAVTKGLDAVERGNVPLNLQSVVDASLRGGARKAKEIYRQFRYPGLYDEDVNAALAPLISQPMTETRVNDLASKIAARNAQRGHVRGGVGNALFPGQAKARLAAPTTAPSPPRRKTPPKPNDAGFAGVTPLGTMVGGAGGYLGAQDINGDGTVDAGERAAFTVGGIVGGTAAGYGAGRALTRSRPAGNALKSGDGAARVKRMMDMVKVGDKGVADVARSMPKADVLEVASRIAGEGIPGGVRITNLDEAVSIIDEAADFQSFASDITRSDMGLRPYPELRTEMKSGPGDVVKMPPRNALKSGPAKAPNVTALPKSGKANSSDLQKALQAYIDKPRTKWDDALESGKINRAEYDWYSGGGTAEELQKTKANMLETLKTAEDYPADRVWEVYSKDPSAKMALELLAADGNQRAMAIRYEAERMRAIPRQTKRMWAIMGEPQVSVAPLADLAGSIGDDVAIETAKSFARMSEQPFLVARAKAIKTADEVYALLRDAHKLINGKDGRPAWADRLIHDARNNEGKFTPPKAKATPKADVVQFGAPQKAPPASPSTVKPFGGAPKPPPVQNGFGIGGSSPRNQSNLPRKGYKEIQVGAASIGVSRNGDQLTIDRLRVPPAERGKGAASRALDEVLQQADSEGLTVFLTPERIGDTGLTDAQLKAFYGRHGFVSNRGSNRDFSTRATMVRRPQPTQNGFGGSKLPMDEASRMQRAREMGFDVDTPLYHGTETAGFSEFKPADPADFRNRDKRIGVYLTENRRNAQSYSGPDRDARILDAEDFSAKDDGTPGIYKVYIRKGDQLEVDWGGKNWDEGPDGEGWSDINDAARYAKEAGYDSIRVRNIRDEGPHGQGYNWGNETIVVFDPKNIRSVNATFDPAQSSSSKLLNGFADKATLASAGTGIAYGELGPLEDLNNDGVKDDADRRAMQYKYGLGGIMTPLLVRGGVGMARAAGRRVAGKAPPVGNALKPPAQSGFGGGKGPKAPPKVILEKRVAGRLGKMAPALSEKTRDAIRSNASLPPALRKSAYEASGNDPALIELAAPFMTGRAKDVRRKAGPAMPKPKNRLTSLDRGVHGARANAARAPDYPPLDSAAELRYRTENARRGAKSSVTRWENDNYDFDREAAGLPQRKAPADRRQRLERQAETAALADRMLKQMKPTADDVEWLQRKATRRLKEIDDAIQRGQMSPDFATAKPRTQAEAKDMARMIFEAEYADLLDDVLSGRVTPKSRSDHALAVFLASSASIGAVGGALAIADVNSATDRQRQARDAARAAKEEDMSIYREPSDPRFVWDWEKVKKTRRAAQTIQSNLNALPPNKSGGRFNLTIDAWGPKTETAVKRWQFENDFEPTGELTQDQWDMLNQQATEARQTTR